MNQIMKFMVLMTRLFWLVCIIPIQSRIDIPVYLAGSTIYRGVLGCNETVSGEVIYNGPDSPQAYESWTLPVKSCMLTISTCFDAVGDPIAFSFVVGGEWTDSAIGSPGNCPDGEPGEDNEFVTGSLNQPNAPCDGNIDELGIILVSTVSDTGSGNYTLRMECADEDCVLCPIDPELDILQQIEDEKNNDPPASVNCTLCDAQCEETEDDIDSSSDDSFDAAQSELENVDEHEIWYKMEEDKGTDNDHEKTYLLKVAQSVWINVYSFLAVVTLSCALLFICIIKRKK